jgi:hypothetical protein
LLLLLLLQRVLVTAATAVAVRRLVSRSIVQAILHAGGRFLQEQQTEWSEIQFGRAVPQPTSPWSLHAAAPPPTAAASTTPPTTQLEPVGANKKSTDDMHMNLNATVLCQGPATTTTTTTTAAATVVQL